MVPSGTAFMANAPFPPFGEGRVSKNFVVKRKADWGGCTCSAADSIKNGGESENEDEVEVGGEVEGEDEGENEGESISVEKEEREEESIEGEAGFG
jgi:hypothetical protein